MAHTERTNIKSLLPFWVFVLLFRFGAGLHYTLLSSMGSYVLPIWLVGILIGGGAFAQLIFDVPAGYALDRIGYIKLLRIATFVFVVGAFVLVLGSSPLLFVITLILSTFGWLFFGPGANAYMLSSAPKEAAGKYMGFYHVMASAGIVLASIVLTLVIHEPIQIMGLVIGIILVGAWITALFTAKEHTSVHSEKKVLRHTYYIRRHFLSHLLKTIKDLNPASTILMLQNLTSSIFYGVIWFTIPLVLLQGGHKGLSGISLSVFDLAVVILGSFLGRLADHGNHKRLVLYGLLLFATMGTLLGFNLNIWFLVIGFLATAGDEMSSVSLWAWLDRLDATHNEDGLINGALVMFEDLGWTIGPILAGMLFYLFGPALTITLAAIPIFAVWLVSLFISRGRPHPEFLEFTTEYPHRHRHKR